MWSCRVLLKNIGVLRWRVRLYACEIQLHIFAKLFAFLSISISSLASIVEAAFHNGLLIRMAILMEESQRRTCIRCEVFPTGSLVVMGSRRNSSCVKWLSPLSEHCCVGNEPQPESKAASSNTLDINVRQPLNDISNQTFMFKWPENTFHLRCSRWQIFGTLRYRSTQEIEDSFSKCLDLIYSWEYGTLYSNLSCIESP